MASELSSKSRYKEQEEPIAHESKQLEAEAYSEYISLFYKIEEFSDDDFWPAVKFLGRYPSE